MTFEKGSQEKQSLKHPAGQANAENAAVMQDHGLTRLNDKCPVLTRKKAVAKKAYIKTST